MRCITQRCRPGCQDLVEIRGIRHIFIEVIEFVEGWALRLLHADQFEMVLRQHRPGPKLAERKQWLAGWLEGHDGVLRPRLLTGRNVEERGNGELIDMNQRGPGDTAYGCALDRRIGRQWRWCAIGESEGHHHPCSALHGGIGRHVRNLPLAERGSRPGKQSQESHRASSKKTYCTFVHYRRSFSKLQAANIKHHTRIRSAVPVPHHPSASNSLYAARLKARTASTHGARWR